MSQLLLGAAAVSVAVGEKTDGAVITTIVALQAVLETFQSYRAEKSLAALRELSAPTANVIRDGREMTISAEQLVPGDLLRVEAGGTRCRRTPGCWTAVFCTRTSLV